MRLRAISKLRSDELLMKPLRIFAWTMKSHETANILSVGLMAHRQRLPVGCLLARSLDYPRFSFRQLSLSTADLSLALFVPPS